MVRARPSRRAAIGAAVVAVHGLLALALRASFAPRPPPPEAGALQVLKVELINVAPPPPPAPELEPTPTAPPSRSPDPESPSAFIAAGAREHSGTEADTAPVIDAFGFDARGLSEACAHAYPESAADLRTPGTLTLLVKVEPSGRPSELKVVVPSGSTALDEAASACLMALGSLEPATVQGRRVAGWQRVVWPRRGASPRP